MAFLGEALFKRVCKPQINNNRKSSHKVSRKKRNIKVGITGNFQQTDLFYLDSELDFFNKCVCFQYLEGHVPELISNDDYSFPRIINAQQCKQARRNAIFMLIKSYIVAVCFVGLMIFSVLLLKYNLNFPRAGLIPFLQYSSFFAALVFLCFLGYLPFYFSVFNRFCRCGLGFYMKNPELCEKYLAWERKILRPCSHNADDFVPQPSYRLRGIKLLMEPDDLYTILQRNLDLEYAQIGCPRRDRRHRGSVSCLNAPLANNSSTSKNNRSYSIILLWGLLIVLCTTPVFLVKYTLGCAERDTIAVIFTGILLTLNLACVIYTIYQIREFYISKRIRRILDRFKKREQKDDAPFVKPIKKNNVIKF